LASAGSILGSGVGGIIVGISLAVSFFFYKKKKNAGDCSQSTVRRRTNPARNRAQPRRHTALKPTTRDENSDGIVNIKMGAADSSDTHNQLYAAPSPTQPAIYDRTPHLKAQVYQNVASEKYISFNFDGTSAFDLGEDNGDADL
jgi:hypothetical protein